VQNKLEKNFIIVLKDYKCGKTEIVFPFSWSGVFEAIFVRQKKQII